MPRKVISKSVMCKTEQEARVAKMKFLREGYPEVEIIQPYTRPLYVVIAYHYIGKPKFLAQHSQATMAVCIRKEV